ncbi:MAG: proteasome subunit beta [Promethearchaeota archaeon]|nr:MAG: proteasome subunit beta [Candidatus Lokiarchaeota archaeon]
MENRVNFQDIDQETIHEVTKSGTTTVAVMVKDGVVVGTESQATAGYTVASKQAKKLFKINDFSAATISGGVADAQYVINQIKALSRLREVEEGEVPDPKYVANVTRNILFSGRSYYLALIIIGGYSQKDEKGKLYGIDLLGTLYKEENFLAFGSGSPYSLGVLEADWKEGMTKEEGIELVRTAIKSSKERDSASGYDFQICYINQDGYQKIE